MKKSVCSQAMIGEHVESFSASLFLWKFDHELVILFQHMVKCKTGLSTSEHFHR